MTKYIMWESIKPKKSDAPKLRRMWAAAKKKPHSWFTRRNLARDYWTAKTARK